MKIYTHDELVDKAAQYLRRTNALVLTEMSGGGGEEADAIAWGANGLSTLIECKATRSDFLSDRHKRFRKYPAKGMAAIRFYLANKSIIRVDELPLNWGLIEPSGRGVRVLVYAKPQAYHSRSETMTLISVIRRIGQNAPQGISVKSYTYQTKCKATLGINLEGDKNENTKRNTRKA